MESGLMLRIVAYPPVLPLRGFPAQLLDIGSLARFSRGHGNPAGPCRAVVSPKENPHLRGPFPRLRYSCALPNPQSPGQLTQLILRLPKPKPGCRLSCLAPENEKLTFRAPCGSPPMCDPSKDHPQAPGSVGVPRRSRRPHPPGWSAANPAIQPPTKSDPRPASPSHASETPQVACCERFRNRRSCQIGKTFPEKSSSAPVTKLPKPGKSP